MTPEVGEQAPQFELPTQRGVPTALDEVLERHGAAIIAFPGRLTRADADARVRALARMHAAHADANIVLLVIVPNRIEEAKRYVEEVGTPFHLLCDTDTADVATRYGVRRRFTLRADTAPALFGVDRTGAIRYRFLGTWSDQSEALADAFEKTKTAAAP